VKRSAALLGLVLLLAAGGVFAFYHLTYPDIRTWDEGTNVDVVASSLEARSFPALVDWQGPFFEKPPLWWYLASTSVAVGGYNAFSLRFPAALAGFVLILLVGLAGRRYYALPGAAAAVLFLLACGHLFIFKPDGIFSTHHVRSADGDVVQIAFMFGAFLAFGRFADGARSGLYAGALLTGLAVLTKGPLGFLPAVVFLIFQTISPRRVVIGRRPAAGAALLLVAVVAPWHIYMLSRFGRGFFDEYFMHAIVHRATDTLEEHAAPWFYYLQLLTGRKLCCSVELVALACVAPFFNRRRLAAYPAAAPLLSIGILMAVISSMATKLAWYVLPLYPYAAVLVGGLFDSCWSLVWDRSRSLRSRMIPSVAALLMIGVVGLCAARNLRDIVFLQRGWMQRFFERSIARCGDELVYADAQLPGDLRYLLRRYRVPRGEPGASRCFIRWLDADPTPSSERACSRVDKAGHLALWECAGLER